MSVFVVLEELSMENYLKRLRASITKLPDKKQYIELITATLTVPVLATAIILNYNNLKTRESTTPAPVQERIIYVSPSGNSSQTAQPTSGECKKNIAPLEIASPGENDTVTDNPVIIDINYTQGDFCSAVWSYRINGGNWSGYDDKSIALYNLPSGVIHFELRVKSLVISSEKTYKRTFTYEGSTSQPTPVVTQSSVSSSSASQ